jgi:hypothetical protein
VTKRKLVRLTKDGPARYTFPSPDGVWEIEQWGFPVDSSPAWYTFGLSWHLWDPTEPESRLRIRPKASFASLALVRRWLTDKYPVQAP